MAWVLTDAMKESLQEKEKYVEKHRVVKMHTGFIKLGNKLWTQVHQIGEGWEHLAKVSFILQAVMNYCSFLINELQNRAKT